MCQCPTYSYGALKTLGEKKATFHEWAQLRSKELREERRVQAKQHRLDFVDMMGESDTLSSTMHWSEVTELFKNDSRWEKVDTSTQKELYADFKLELVKREKERKRAARKEKTAAFRKVSEFVRERRCGVAT